MKLAGRLRASLVVRLLVVMVVAAGFFGIRALRPLGPLVRTVRRILEGDRSARAELSGSAEFRVVATEVNRMADALDRPLTEVEQVRLYRQAVDVEQRLRLVLESAPDATFVVSRAGTIDFVNRRVTEMFGYEPEELLGEPVEVLVPERLREGHVGHRNGFVEAPRTRPMGAGLDLWARRRDGTEFPIEVSLSPVEGEHGFQVVAAVRDVTQRRRAEETARALREMRSRQREAMELNDNIVQGLTIAAWSFELDDLEAARDAVDRTLAAARELINDILRQGTAEGVEAGDLVRERPAEFGS